MEEEWRPIKGFEGRFEVSNLGRVRRLSYTTTSTSRTGTKYKVQIKPMMKKSTKGDDGYYDVGLGKDGKDKFFSVHRLVAEAFIPNPENKPTVNHIDGDKSNNRFDNLEWATHQEQAQHARRMNLIPPNNHIEVSRANLKKWNDKHVIVVRSTDGLEEYVGWETICKNFKMGPDKVRRYIDNGFLINGKKYILTIGLDQPE